VRNFRSALIFFLVVLIVAPSVAAEDRIALLIGNADYDYTAQLKNPPNDVARVAEVLRNLGFEDEDIETLTDLDEDALEDALVAFQAKAETADTALVFYSGHGMEINGQNYLIPIDAELRRSGAERAEAVSLDFAIEAVSAASRLSIVILDACRTGPPGPRGAKGFVAVQADRPGLAIAFSTRPGEVAWDGTGDTSPYTRALTEALIRAPNQDVRVLLTSLGSKTTQYAGGEQRPFARFGDMSANLVALGLPASVTPPANPSASEVGSCDGVEVDLASGGTKCIKPGSGESFEDCPECPEMVVVPAGSFMMGSPESEEGRREAEGPQHEVKIPQPFAVGKFEVTWDKWEACVAAGGCTHNPDDEGWGRGNRPVIKISWNHAQAYAKWLSEKTGKTYRLLSEAEWEYAARSGTTGPFSFEGSVTTDKANYSISLSERGFTVPVGSFPPNPWGLYDVHGNVSEWVEDCLNDSYARKPQILRAVFYQFASYPAAAK